LNVVLVAGNSGCNQNQVAVVVETPAHSALAGPLTYRHERALEPGTLLRVPLGRRTTAGLSWPATTGAPDGVELRAVVEAFDALPALGAQWCALVEFAARYYQRGIGEVALAVLPPELRRLGAAQLAQRVARLRKAAAEAPPPHADEPAPAPTAAQGDALARLAELPRSAPALLHGLTGSGKTEVYLRSAERALTAGRQALVLVPEINLTPQLEARFAARFGGRRIVSLHSALTPAQRLRAWLLAHLGLADLVLGTRLAVFAPLPRLGLIVVDEEHDPSYKQQEGARYSARDLAVWRGRQLGVPVLLGSATPSLESWQRALDGRYAHVALPARVGDAALPTVRLFDLNRLPRGEAPALAPPIIDAVRARVERGEQALLLLNRRGYAPVLHCTNCGWKSACAHCSAWRVFHKVDRTLRCHHCGAQQRVPRHCPDCGNADIAPIGRGTERLEEQLAALLPGARIGRIDADTTRRAGALQARLAEVHAGDIDVLVGTQMVAKGHDFRRVTLVAAVNPDSALFASDFRAAERLFALLMQAAGRAGRDRAFSASSEMWLQTWHPQHALFAALRAHDYDAFAAAQLAERRAAGMPPFAHLALLRTDARSADAAQAFLHDAASAAATLPGADAVMVYPPVPLAVARVAGIERMQMLVESASRPALQRLLAAWQPALQALRSRHRTVQRWAIDVDPHAI
jgi:primosomal protein N' (replication factor Y)